MDWRIVQRCLSTADPHEAHTLLEGLGPQTRHLLQLLAAYELAILLPVLDDVLGCGAVNSGHILQKRRRSRVQIHAHMVHRRFHHAVQAFAEPLLLHVVLVLPHADRLRLDLHQLRQRVLHPPGNRDGAALRHIQVRELLLGQLGGGVDTGAGFADDAVDQSGLLKLADQGADELLGLPGGGAVADHDQLQPVLRDEPPENRLRLRHLIIGRGRIGHGNLQQLAGIVHRRQLAAGAVGRVNTQHPFALHRGLQQKAAQIAAENPDGLLLRLLRQLSPHLTFDGRGQQTLIGVLNNRQQHLPDSGLPPQELPGHIVMDLLGGYLHPDLQHILPLPAVNGQNPVRRQAAHRLGIFIVHFVHGLRRFVLGLRGNHAVVMGEPTQPGPQLGVIGDVLRQNIHGAG
ncbi:hypothetical protein D3C75_677620 [compost metagenome]